MEKINWASYDFDDFELFCGALFTFEFGKSYKPFLAAGKDYGIDGSFEGAYGQYSGKWRFQFKFSSSPRANMVSRLKTQIKAEATKLGDEDFFVLATNVDLLPQEHAEIERLFYVSLAIQKEVKFFIWDGAKLNIAALKFPILLLWLQDGFKTAQLVPYQTVFREALNDVDFQPLTMANFFVGRIADLDYLSNWLNDDRAVAVLEGEGGIGKTRLVLEFFKQKVDQTSDWLPLVLVNRSLDFDKLTKALSNATKVVILVDDAHAFLPETIADLKRIADSVRNVKILLTVRKLEAFRAMSLVREYELKNILKIELTPLTKSETEDAFSRHLETLRHRSLSDLADISFGKPILIVAILNAVKAGIPINKIREDGFFRGYVRNYFATYIAKVKEETGLAPLRIGEILQVVALLEPFDFVRADILNRIAKLLALSFVDVQFALQLLLKFSFASGRREQSIRPDYYSDIILSEGTDDRVLQTLEEFTDFSDNIIINLSSVDEIATSAQRDLLQKILLTYIAKITVGNLAEIEKILSTMLYVVYVQPELSKRTVATFLGCFKIPENPIARFYQSGSRYDGSLVERCLTKVISIIDRLYENVSSSDFARKKAMELFSETKDEKVANVFDFDSYDVATHFSMSRQTAAVGDFDQTVRNCSPHILDYVSLCLAKMLVLDFRISEWNATPADGVTIYTYYLPTSQSVKEFRQKAITLLFSIFQKTAQGQNRSKVLRQILDVPREILSTRRNPKQYTNDAEIQAVLKFLVQNIELFDLLQRTEVHEKIYQYEKWGLPKKLGTLANKVKSTLKPRDLVEELSLLFSKLSLSAGSSSSIDKLMSSRCKELAAKVEQTELADAIVTFLASQETVPYLYLFFQREIELYFPKLAKEIYERLFLHGGSLFLTFGTAILSSAYIINSDFDFFWEQVKRLEQQNRIDGNQVLLSVYTQRYFKRELISKADCNLLITIFKQGRPEDRFLLGQAIHLLFLANHPAAMSTSTAFLQVANQREGEHFFTFLSENKEISAGEKSQLILLNSIPFDISYEIERCLNRILLTEGSDKLFEYFLRRFAHKKLSLERSESYMAYDFVPTGAHSHLFDDAEDQNWQMFETAVRWYVDLSSEGQQREEYFAKNLIEYLLPAESIDDTVAEIYQSLIESFKDRLPKLQRLLETLAVFHVKNEHLVQLVASVLTISCELTDPNSQEYQEIWYACYNAITEMGGKSGTYGMPFQEDLDLKELVEKSLVKYQQLSPFHALLLSVLKRVESDILGSVERGESSASW